MLRGMFHLHAPLVDARRASRRVRSATRTPDPEQKSRQCRTDLAGNRYRRQRLLAAAQCSVPYSLRSSPHLRTETGGECSWAHMRVECRGDRALLARMACAVAFSQWDAGDGILRACAKNFIFFDLKKRP